MTNYTVRLVTDDSEWASSRGFVNENCLGKFDAIWNINGFAHDLFEHWFEGTRYFKTRELSQAGECVACGIRQYLDDNSSIVERFMGYNMFHGVEWNSWNSIVGQVKEVLDGNDTFPNDFNYKHLSKWNGKNEFKGYCKEQCKYSAKGFDEQIERAFSYGYWLGGHVFTNLDLVEDFLGKLNRFLTKTGMGETDMHDNYLENFSSGFTMHKKTDIIIGRFDNGVTISTNKNVEPAIDRWLKYYDI